jgi:hypothetical protein
VGQGKQGGAQRHEGQEGFYSGHNSLDSWPAFGNRTRGMCQ